MTPMLSHPNLRDGVEARAYQLLAAKQAISGSTLLVMPTGLGKTAVQWMAMANALEGDGKIVLVAPTTGLVAQQARMAKDFINIDSEKIVTLTGQDRPAKREKIKPIKLARIFSLFHIILINLLELYIEFLCLKDK